MKKSTKGPTWKQGMIGRQDYVPPQTAEAKLTEEQKKWPRVSLGEPLPGTVPPAEERELNPVPPVEPPAAGA